MNATMLPAPPLQITPRGIRVGDRELPLLSGAMHYWRLEPSRWESILAEVAQLGYPIVETYVPWSVHELAPGQFDFGQTRPQLDLPRFLRLAQAQGLYVLVRPGPHINSELTDFGFPKRVLERPEVQMRTARETPAWFPGFPRPFPIPSYCSETFYQEVEAWFAAVMPVITPQLYPHGSVVAVQVDNELSNFFRTALYDVDYHPDAIKRYRRFVLERYQRLERVQEVYGLPLETLEQLQPPRRYAPKENLRYHLDWARFQGLTFLEAWQRIKAMLERYLPAQTPLYTNQPLRAYDAPFDLGAIEELLDQVGVDLYYTRRDLRIVQETCRALSARTRLPSCPEFGAGCFLTWTPTTQEDNMHTALAATMYGVRSFNFYMLVDRERWYGSPIRTDGSRREPLASFYARLNTLFQVHRLTERPRPIQIGLLRSAAYDRLMGVGSLVQPVSTLVLVGVKARLSLLARDTGAFSLLAPYEDRLDEGMDILHRLRHDFDFGEVLQALPLQARYPVLVAPSFRLMDGQELERLLSRAREGATVILGPEKPERDLETGALLPWPVGEEQLHPFGRVQPFGKGQVVLAVALEPALRWVVERLGLVSTGIEGPPGKQVYGVRLPAFEDCAPLLWVLNAEAEAQEVHLQGVASLHEFFTGMRVGGHGAQGVTVTVPGHSVMVFEGLEAS
ncbi:MAG: beta-galactosidase [Myxococcota bacterium]